MRRHSSSCEGLERRGGVGEERVGGGGEERGGGRLVY